MVKAILPKLGSNQIDQIFAKEMSGRGSRVDRLGDHRTLFANRQPQPQGLIRVMQLIYAHFVFG